MIQELSAKEMEARSRVFVSLKVDNIKKAIEVLSKKFKNVKLEEDYLRVYDEENTEEIISCLLENGINVSQMKKNKVGLEEYYIELMSKKEAE